MSAVASFYRGLAAPTGGRGMNFRSVLGALVGGDGHNQLFGDTGNDSLWGDNDASGSGANYVDGEDGDDLLMGYGGGDTLISDDAALKLWRDHSNPAYALVTLNSNDEKVFYFNLQLNQAANDIRSAA